MGVIVCDSPTGPFSVTVIPKCGSTTVRLMLAPFAQPGQYTATPDDPTNLVTKAPGWQLGTRYQGQCGDRSWAVLRNPYRRILSRWREKQGSSWPEYLTGLGNGHHPMVRSQTWYLGVRRPARMLDIEQSEWWRDSMSVELALDIRGVPIARSSGNYDWTQPYRDHPETRDIVRNAYSDDWNLGINWSEPL